MLPSALSGFCAPPVSIQCNHITSNEIHRDGARVGQRLGGHRESGETGDSREEGDTQWRQGRLGGHRESGETGDSGEEGDTQWRQGRLVDIGSQGRQGSQGKRRIPNGDKADWGT